MYVCSNHSTNSNSHQYDKWLNTLWYGPVVNSRAARDKSNATQNTEDIHAHEVAQKDPETKRYILTDSTHTEFKKQYI